MNVYLDPSSYSYLSNELFKEDSRWNLDDRLLPWRHIKKYCEKNGIALNTIDYYNKKRAMDNDIYLSHDHKSLFRRLYWHFLRDRRYPISTGNKFKKKILFQFEPPIVMPDVYDKIESVVKQYDEAYFVPKTRKMMRVNVFDEVELKHDIKSLNLYQTYGDKLDKYWNNKNRRLIVLISTNKKPRTLGKLLMLIGSGGFSHWGHEELLSKRNELVDYFSRSDDIDVYGNGWEKYKAWRGYAVNRHEIMSGYKFSVAFENSAVAGFITERIFDSFYCGTIPIYLGAPDIADYIPSDCFIDMRDFGGYDELSNYIKGMSQERIDEYRENIKRFLESDKFKVFTKEHFLKTFLDAIK